MKRFIFLILVLMSLSACQTTKTASIDTAVSSQQSSLTDLFTEKITLERGISPLVQNVVLNVELPPSHKFLEDAEPYIKLYTGRKVILEKQLLQSPQEIIPLNKKVLEEKLYADVGIFYCREDAQGLCLAKILKFEVAVDPFRQAEDLKLTHVIKAVY